MRVEAFNWGYATEKYSLSEPAQNHKNRKNLRSRIAHRLKRERAGKIKTEPGTRIASRLSLVEQKTGIEPAFLAWEANVLPLNYFCI